MHDLYDPWDHVPTERQYVARPSRSDEARAARAEARADEIDERVDALMSNPGALAEYLVEHDLWADLEVEIDGRRVYVMDTPAYLVGFDQPARDALLDRIGAAILHKLCDPEGPIAREVDADDAGRRTMP